MIRPCAACEGEGTGYSRQPWGAWEPADCPACDGSGCQDPDPEPITLTYMPRTGRRADWLGWFLLGLAVGVMAIWSAFL